MLDDLGQTLTGVLRGQLPAGVEFRLEPPTEGWRTGEQAPAGALGLFLHRVLENRETGSAGVWTEDRGADGRVVSRAGAERRYDFCFLVTAWASDLAAEFALLGGVLRAVANKPVLGTADLAGSLSRARGTVTLAIGNPALPAASADIWTALGLSPRSSLDLVATAPLPALDDSALARPPELIDLGVTGPAGTTKSAALGSGGTLPAELARGGDPRAAGRPPRRPAARITEGVRDG
ncbi:Pvc16 family protein [Kribbella sp. NPDC056861]|uniref:Pvc16 family protein n=1 Tax=Kribbella sp. NPDC056861 TaxID=3154857 RepID=UPI0034436D61